MIYLDNAATSHPKPPSVYQRVDAALRNWSANPGRSGHQMAIGAARIIFQTRESIASLFHISDPDRIIFTPNATGALNLAILGLLRPGDHCIATTMEHNSVIRPLHALSGRGVAITKIAAAQDGSIDPQAIASAVNANTRLIVVTHASNVTGTLTPIAEIASLAHARNVPVLIDAAQTAGAVPIDIGALGVDLLACPGHKALFGPQGTGFLYIAPHINLDPILFGGTGSRSELETMPDFAPDRYEAGTLNTPGIAGLGAGVEFLLERGVEHVRAHEIALMRQLTEGLSGIDGVTIFGPRDPSQRSGVLLFTIDGIDPAEIGDRLDQEFGIAVRVGLHCAPLAHRTIGTFPIGGVRMSPGFFTTAEEIRRTLSAVARIAAHRTVTV